MVADRRLSMGILSRMSTVVKAKMSRIVDNAENPNETLDYSYEKQLEMLRDVKRGVVQMVTAKRRIQQQATVVQSNMAKLDSQARQAMEAGREDLARLALQRKQASIIELQGLDEQISQMEMEQEKLTVAEQRLTSKVAAFRTKKETIKAQYNAAQAQVRIGEALSGMSEEMGDLSLAMERAENKTQHMRARAGAIDELSTIGMLDDFTGTREDDISRELAQLTSSQSVEEELAAMRPGLPAADRKQLPQLPESGS